MSKRTATSRKGRSGGDERLTRPLRRAELKHAEEPYDSIAGTAMRKRTTNLCADAQDIKARVDAGDGFELGSLAWACQQIEQVKAGLRVDPGQAYSLEFTRAAEILREHDPVQFNSLRRLLKDKQVRLGEFDRLIHQRQQERAQDNKRARSAAARALRSATAATASSGQSSVTRPHPGRNTAGRVVPDGIQIGCHLASAEGLFWLKGIGRGAPPVQLPLANFTARIVTEIQRDDGLESSREFEIEACLSGRTQRFVVAAKQFGGMRWVMEKLGARAVIAAGAGTKDRVRESIQLLSSAQLVERTVYTHTGWRKLGTEWVYLHGGGALGASGPIAGVETSLPAALAPFILPPPPAGADLRSAITASLALLDLAPDRVTVPTLGAVWRSILGTVDFSLFVHGATGRFKTALAALIQQHFGAEFSARHLPGSWASTANFNESLAFIAKDAARCDRRFQTS